MKTDTTTGKTAWDLLASILRSTSLVSSIFLVMATFWFVIHWVAKPGTEINLLWGLVKYQKHDSEVSSHDLVANLPPDRHLIASWSLEHSQATNERSYKALIPGTKVTISWSYGKLVFAGPTVRQGMFAAAAQGGNSLVLMRNSNANWVTVDHCFQPCEVEIGVEKRYFLIRPELVRINDDARIFAIIKDIPAPNRKLEAFSKLPEF